MFVIPNPFRGEEPKPRFAVRWPAKFGGSSFEFRLTFWLLFCQEKSNNQKIKILTFHIKINLTPATSNHNQQKLFKLNFLIWMAKIKTFFPLLKALFPDDVSSVFGFNNLSRKK